MQAADIRFQNLQRSVTSNFGLAVLSFFHCAMTCREAFVRAQSMPIWQSLFRASKSTAFNCSLGSSTLAAGDRRWAASGLILLLLCLFYRCHQSSRLIYHSCHSVRAHGLASISDFLQTVMFTLFGHFELREEHMLLTMFDHALAMEFADAKDLGG